MNDLKFALRQLLKNPGFTAVAVLTLTLGIGVNTSMFTALQALLNRHLPYREPGSLVQVFQSSPGSAREPHHSVPDFLDYQESGTFEYMAALNDRPFIPSVCAGTARVYEHRDARHGAGHYPSSRRGGFGPGPTGGPARADKCRRGKLA